MKVRNGFVSNSSSSSFVVAIPKGYKLSDEEMSEIRAGLEDYDSYFSHYEKLAEDEGNTEVLDEREKIQKMLESGNFEEMTDDEPVTDDIKNADIANGLQYLKTDGVLWQDSEYWDDVPASAAASAIVEVLHDKVIITSIDGPSGCGQTINILAESNLASTGMKLLKESLINEDS
jgi:hypothetical protein